MIKKKQTILFTDNNTDVYGFPCENSIVVAKFMKPNIKHEIIGLHVDTGSSNDIPLKQISQEYTKTEQKTQRLNYTFPNRVTDFDPFHSKQYNATTYCYKHQNE